MSTYPVCCSVFMGVSRATNFLASMLQLLYNQFVSCALPLSAPMHVDMRHFEHKECLLSHGKNM